MARKEIFKKSKQRTLKKMDIGYYLISLDGEVYNHLDPSQHRKMSGFKIKEGDEIQMWYDKEKLQLMVRNKTKKLSYVLNNICNYHRNLYYCLGVSSFQLGIEIVEEDER